MAKVAILKIKSDADESYYFHAIEKLMRLIDSCENHLEIGNKVFIKPNLGTTNPKKAISSPLYSATLKFFSQNGCDVYTGEDPTICYSEEEIYKKWELDKITINTNSNLVYLRSGLHKTYRVPQPLHFNEIEVSSWIEKVDCVISLSKLKSINICSVSLSLKNMKGLIRPAWKRKFHCEGLEKGIVDLNQIIRPGLAIIDGTYGYDDVERKSQKVGLLIGSYDCVAADAVCATIIGFDPYRIDHIAYANSLSLGTCNMEEIEIVGEPLESLINKHNFSKPKNPFDIAKNSGGKLSIVQGEPCSACLNELGNDLDNFKGDYNSLGSIVILVGPKACYQKTDKGNTENDIIILYGNCLKNHQKRGLFVGGCPPGYPPAGAGSIAHLLRKLETLKISACKIKPGC